MTAPDRELRPRRTWPQRFLILGGVLLAAGCFGAAQIFWDARTVLADLPRIRLGSDVLAQPGRPGDPVNFLLVGVDSSEGLDPDDPVRSGRNLAAEAEGRFLSDTILLLRLDPATGDAAVLSIPRDLYVDVPGSSQWKINSTLLIGGMDTLIETIDANLAIPVNHFVMVDFAGFARLIELVGGVPVYFPHPTRDLGSFLSVPEAGCWILDGRHSLGYVRARALEEQIDGEWVPLSGPAPDLARIERQQEFMVLALERALVLGGNEISRIREFVDAGTQSVQLDERLTPGDLLDLASAFADYDTEALRVATLPVQPLFAEDGRYLGEELRVAEAVELLEIFQGAADSIRPADVEVSVTGADTGSVERARQQLSERGFVIDEGQSDEDVAGRTVIAFDPVERARAEILARYLQGLPALDPRPDVDLTLTVGPDFAGVRPFPRPRSDVERFVDRAIAAAGAPEPPPTTATASPPPTSADNPSTSTTTPADVSDGLPTAENPTSTIERGRPPEGVRCLPIGESGQE